MRIHNEFKLGATRDETLLSLLSHVRFNRYDQKYIQSLLEYKRKEMALSENQNALFEKMMHKYRKQIKKLGSNYKDILALEWELPLVTKAELNAKTYFKLLDDNSMEMYFNFDKKMIEEVRTLIHDDAGRYLKKTQDFMNSVKYDFNWYSDQKIWHGPFNVHLLRDLYYYCKKHSIVLDSTITDLFDYYNRTYGSKENWTPRVVISNGRMYISGIAESMLPYLDDISMNDCSVQNVERLTKLGLKAPNEYSRIAEYIESNSPNKAHSIKSDDDKERLIEYIKASERKFVLYVTQIKVFNDHELKPREELDEEWYKLTRLPNVHLYAANEGLQGPTEYLDKLNAAGYNTLLTTQALDGLVRSQKEIGKFGLEADKVVHILVDGPT